MVKPGAEGAGASAADAKNPFAAGGLAELTWKVLQRSGEPPITRFVAVELAKDHYFDLAAAERDLGFHPAYSMEEALSQTISDLKARGF